MKLRRQVYFPASNIFEFINIFVEKFQTKLLNVNMMRELTTKVNKLVFVLHQKLCFSFIESFFKIPFYSNLLHLNAKWLKFQFDIGS